MLAGNHEHEIWQQIIDGETFGLTADSLQSLRRLIESIDLFHVDGPFLFMHSYPTTEFLRFLLHYKNVSGNNVNGFNDDQYKKVFTPAGTLSQYCYTRSKPGEDDLLYDPSNSETYFRKNGSEIATLLTALEIDCIVHGHKPQRSGTQADYEFRKWLPDIRMIGNDTRVSEQGIGATVVRMDVGRAPQVVFVNADNSNKKTRNKVKHLLRSSAPVSSAYQSQTEEIEHFRKLQKQLEGLSKEHKSQITELKGMLESEKTSNLLLKEELLEHEENLAEARQQLTALKVEKQDLESEITQAVSVDVETDRMEDDATLKQGDLLSTVSRLKQEVSKHNQARKRAVGYLRVCHEKNRQMEAELERSANETTDDGRSRQIELEHESVLRKESERSIRRWRIYALVVTVGLGLLALNLVFS